MKMNDSFSVQSLTKRDRERIREEQFLNQPSRKLFFGAGSVVMIHTLTVPFSTRRLFRHTRIPTNLKQYWDQLSLVGLVLGLVLIGIAVLDYLLPWIDMKIGKKYVTRGQLQEKKKLLRCHLLKIKGTKREWIRVDRHFYHRVQSGDTVQITRTFLRSRKTYSKVKPKAE